MYNPHDPRFRRTLNQISQNLESANESAQVGLFSISENYIKPCFGSVAAFIEPCTAACFPGARRGDRLRGARGGRGRGGRLEHSFDFYDDWEEDENDALLSLENEEFDRLMGVVHEDDGARRPERRSAIMNYGSRGDIASPRTRRRSAVLPYDGGPDPTVIPNQSYFGFLTKLPFNIGRRGLRYKPSAAGLQERGKDKDGRGDEIEPLLEGEDEGEAQAENSRKQHGRKRSVTTGSGHTTDSFSSRGDIFPSDDEDDAIPLDDEFTVALDRRTSGPNRDDDGSSGRTKGSKKTTGASQAGQTQQPAGGSSSTRKIWKRSRKSSSSTQKSLESEPEMGQMPTFSDDKLRHEEQKAKAEVDEDIERKREAAYKLAVQRGLQMSDEREDSTEAKNGDANLKSTLGTRQEPSGAPSQGPDYSVQHYGAHNEQSIELQDKDQPAEEVSSRVAEDEPNPAGQSE